MITLLIAIMFLMFIATTITLYRMNKYIDDCCFNLGVLKKSVDNNFKHFDNKVSFQIKNIRSNNSEIDLTKIHNDINKMMKVYEEIDNSGYINSVDDLNEFMEDINDFDVKDKIGNLEYIVEKWQDIDDIETNITDLNDRMDDLTHTVSKFLVEDDVLELIHNEIPINEDTIKRLNQFDRFIEALKATTLEEETNE